MSDDIEPDGLRAVLAELDSRRNHDPVTGQFIAGAVAAGTTLARSAQFWRAVEDVKRELASRVSADLAADDQAPETLRGLIDAYAEARILRSAMFLRIADLDGPISAKGAARALFKTYLAALDRETKLAMVLGLQRRSKHVDPIEAVRQAVAEANRK
jgi:hypothetical protein